MMDENIENSGEENNNDLILNLDLNPDSVICPFMFELQHSLSSGEEEISVENSGSDTRRNVLVLVSVCLSVLSSTCVEWSLTAEPF